MQEFIYTLTPNRPGMVLDEPDAEETAILGHHLEYLNGLLSNEQAILFGRTQGTGIHTFGIVIFKAKDQVQAEAIMHADPAVKAGVMTAKLFPYKVIGMSGRS